ncbi:ferredoxin-NADP reductase/predicted pyridoxine 5'-phosphate oxidase superfamily flavin-nucleotide-binding protein [Paraburkholderia sp. GAS199]|uniref:2Fe-2S iron-sulfur cluster-binding protein n=1 Tax=Paraburkholderia sp. GAS199 TaxID=3035126 RepID=UPI003D232663
MSNTPPSPGWGLEQSPFHEGELAVQERVGVREKMAVAGRQVVREYLTEQHREFFGLLPYIFVGSVDAQGRPWASILLGKTGFLDAIDTTTVKVKATPLHGDPLADNLRTGAEIAMLGVQLHTRRRNRFFGSVADLKDGEFTIAVRQTLGICPQYIQGREPVFHRDPALREATPVHRHERIDATVKAMIGSADTYFIASANMREGDGVARGADVSHRGGRPGFVRVDNETTLTAPDFVGNFIFNTLGNWQLDNRAGLLFIDFARGDLVYIAATAEIIWDGPEVRAFAGAQRLVRYHVTEVIRVEASLPAHFTPPEDSPLLARTGSWSDVAQTLEVERYRNEWRPFRVARVVEETAQIRSFYLEPTDGRGLAAYSAGQFLPVRVQPDGWSEAASRTYTLSSASGGSSYRITVKREGAGGISDWLHDHATVGTLIEGMAPRGSFVFDVDARTPVVLISAGVGITPMIAMVDTLLVNNGRTIHHAPIFFVHATRTPASHAFRAFIDDKAARASNFHPYIRYSRPLPDDAILGKHESMGMVDIELLKSILPFDNYHFYLCGPSAFMQSLYDGLTGLGVRDSSIHFESFGPASVKRRRETLATDNDAEESVVVKFARSGKTARWRPAHGSLLDLAESCGINALSSCRVGVCGTCSAKVLDGTVDYAQPPGHDIVPGEALICCATPHPGPHLEGSLDREGVTLDL